MAIKELTYTIQNLAINTVFDYTNETNVSRYLGIWVYVRRVCYSIK